MFCCQNCYDLIGMYIHRAGVWVCLNHRLLLIAVFQAVFDQKKKKVDVKNVVPLRLITI